MGGDGDTQLVIDKTATQLKCLLEQLVNLVQQDDHVIHSDNDTVKVSRYNHYVIMLLYMCAYRMDHVITMDHMITMDY